MAMYIQLEIISSEASISCTFTVTLVVVRIGCKEKRFFGCWIFAFEGLSAGSPYYVNTILELKL